jgi:hypothetical protein
MLDHNWFLIVSPGTVLAAILAGFSLSIILRHIGISENVPRLLFLSLLIIGESFIALLITARWILGSAQWHVWVGVGVLWVIYAGAATLAMRGRK